MKKVLFIGLQVILSVSLTITVLILATPLYPFMPTSGLDPSWAYAINEATAARLAFGREVIFTFGPYGAIWTRSFHLGTDALAIGTGIFFGLCFGTVSVLLARQSLWWGVCLLLVLGGQMYSRDALFASYALLLVVAFGNAALATDIERRSFSRIESLLFIVLLFALGLLPLIKGSLILIAVASSIASSFVFLAAGLPLLAVASILTPATGVMAFWELSGQSLGDLPFYFSNMLRIISGYTDSLAVDGDVREIVVFVAASAGLLYVLFTMPAKPAFKLSLLVAFGAFLFSAFKGGFVRHDEWHASFAAAAIILAPVAINLSVFKPGKSSSIWWLAVMAWFVIAGRAHSIPQILYLNLFETYEQGIEGFRQRVFKTVDLNRSFSDRMNALAQEAGFPKLDGTTDIYNYGQGYLLASGNRWRPRPVLQSNMASTPYLARLDRDHLAGADGADNVFIRLEGIDDHFPLLEDGPSWPILLSKYTLSHNANEHLLLKRLQGAKEPQLRQVLSRDVELGHFVNLPDNDLLYAEIDVRSSLFGRVASFLYKSSPLRMSVTLASGRTRDFRIVPGMASAGFLLSPIVENTQDLGYLFGERKILTENKVRSLRIEGDSLFWKPEYQVRISTVDLVATTVTQVGSRRTNELEDGAPPELTVKQTEICEGSIDHVNRQSISPTIKIVDLASVDGWMTISGKDGTTPDDVYVVLTTEGGRTIYVKAWRTDRSDLRAHFGQPEVRNAGFVAIANVSSLIGDLTLGLARRSGTRFEVCKNFEILLYRGDLPHRAAFIGYDPVDDTASALKGEVKAVCEGKIDTLNSGPPVPAKTTVGGMMQIQGWTTISGKDAIVPDIVFVRIESEHGKVLYFKTRAMPRDDVRIFFDQPKLLNAGFVANIDTSNLKGDYTLGVSRLYQRTFERCDNLTFPISIRD
jgi:hypothetical protein